MHKWTQASEWWRMPLLGVAIGGPISLTASLFLASYGADGPYGGFGRLLMAGMTASVPIFAAGGLLFAPVEIWLTDRPRRLPILRALLVRTGTLGLAGIVGAIVANAIVIELLAAPPPPSLFPVLMLTYPFIGLIIGLAYTFYDVYVYQLRLSTQLTQEMHIARTIQQGLFPRQCPSVDGYELAATCRPAHETGGDFFDFITFDRQVGMVIADVAGKGMPAALLMANTRALWRAEARLKHDPGETLRRVNRSLYRDINSGGFVTMIYALLEPETGRLHIAGAGHPLPLLLSPQRLQEVPAYGLPLGLTPDATYDTTTIQLAPGEAVLFYTDGVTEALNASRELWGEERLRATLRSQPHRSAQELVALICDRARQFSGRTPQSDDITVMALKALDRRPVPPPPVSTPPDAQRPRPLYPPSAPREWSR